jgi:hypothetical protein
MSVSRHLLPTRPHFGPDPAFPRLEQSFIVKRYSGARARKKRGDPWWSGVYFTFEFRDQFVKHRDERRAGSCSCHLGTPPGW